MQAHKLRGGFDTNPHCQLKIFKMVKVCGHTAPFVLHVEGSFRLFHLAEILKLTLMFQTRVRLQLCGNNLKKLLPSFIMTGFLSSMLDTVVRYTPVF